MEVLDCNISRDAKWILSSSEDDTIRLWERASGRCAATYEGHLGAVYSCRLSSDNTFAVSASWDKTLKIWDLRDHSPRFVRYSSCLATLEGHTGRVLSCALGGRSDSFCISASKDKTLRIWSLNNILSEDPSKRHVFCVGVLHGHQGRVFSCDVSDSDMIASGSGDQSVKLWDIHSQSCVTTFTGHTAEVRRVVFCKSGSTLASASADKTVRLWSVRSDNRRCVRVFRGHANVSQYRMNSWGAVLDVSFSLSSKLLVSASSDRTVRIWNGRNGQEIERLKAHDAMVTCCDFSPTGYFVVSGSVDSTVKIYYLPRSFAKRAGSFIASRQLLALWPLFAKLYGGWIQYPALILRRIAEY